MKNFLKNMKIIKIILTIAIPGAGKSTWAKEFVRKNNNYVRVSRDDYRMMLSQSQQLDPKGEKLVTTLVQNAIASAANAKYNVIVDQTNVNIRHLNPLIEFCQNYGDVEFKIFDVPVEVAIERDKNRDAMVGEDVIRKMYKDYLSLYDSNFDFSVRKKKVRMVSDISWKVNGNLPKAIIYDIDGTLAHANGKRGHFDWDRVHVDSVDEKVRETLNVFKNAGYKIIIVTGRDGSCEELTKMWLDENKIHFDYFYIRPANNYDPDTKIKKNIYENHIKGNFNVLGVFDDRNKVVSMWRELGVKCFQVLDGDY